MFEQFGLRTLRVRGGMTIASALLLGTAVCAYCAPAFAADDQASPPVEGAKQVADAGSGEVETVLVTARRKTENAQNVPISLTAVTADTLAANGITSALKLQQVIPSLDVISYNARNTNIIIRGLGSNVAITTDGIEAGVGVYVDGVLYARPAEATFNLPDISSLEELRGPQGTLYGKNTVAGAINISTELPTDTFEAKAEASLGTYLYQQYSGTMSGSLNDDGTLMGRLTAFDNDHDGYIYNVTTHSHDDNYHDHGVRGQFLYQPTDNFHLRVIADYSTQQQACCISLISQVVTTLADGKPLPRNFYVRSAEAGYTPLPFDPYARLTDADSNYHAKMEQGGLSAQADWTFDGFTLTSISAYRFWNWNPSNDTDETALPVLTQARQANQEKEITQELRIASPTGQQFEYSGGLFYFHEDDDGFGQTTYGSAAPIWVLGASNPVTQAALNGFDVQSRSTPRISSYAGYGQATWHILPQLDLTGGIRYTYEYKTGGYLQYQKAGDGADLANLPPAIAIPAQAIRNAVGPVESYKAHTSDGLLGGMASLTYRFTDDLNAYATYSHGSKSGGLNLTNLPTGVPRVVAPEEIDDYEVGFKTTLLQNHLVFNADAFWENDSNYQTTLVTTSGAIVTYIANIPSVRSRGFEADIRATPFDGLSTYLSLAYTDAIYVSYPNAPCPIEKLDQPSCNLSGGVLPAVSRFALSAGGEYDRTVGQWQSNELIGYLGADVSYRSSYQSAVNDSIYSSVPGYGLLNLRAGVRTGDGRWDLSVWALNATNTNYTVTSGAVSFNSGAIGVLLGDPRVVGGTLKFNY